MPKKLTGVATGIALALMVIITFALIIGEFKQSIKAMDKEISNGSKIDRKLMIIQTSISKVDSNE